MNKFEKLKSIEWQENQKVTLVIRNSEGAIEIVQKHLASIEEYIPYPVAPDKMHGAVLTLKHKRLNRKDYPPRIMTVEFFTEFIIYDGWIELDIDDILYEVRTNAKQEPIRYPKYPSYVSNAFYEILEKYPDCIISDI